MLSDINQLIIEERLRNYRQTFLHPPYLLEQRLMTAIILADKEQATAVLDQINSLERAYLSPDPIRSIKNSLIASCTLFTRASIQGGIDSETAFMLSDLYIRQIEELTSQNEAESFEYDMVMGFVDLVSKSNRQMYSPIVNKAQRYIHMNAQKRLTLTGIAAYCGVHPNYLSSMFSSEAGCSLMSYYDNQRCAAIKLFLSNTNFSLTNIAATFDFSSISYFSSYFKRQTNTTPSNYRKEVQGD